MGDRMCSAGVLRPQPAEAQHVHPRSAQRRAGADHREDAQTGCKYFTGSPVLHCGSVDRSVKCPTLCVVCFR